MKIPEKLCIFCAHFSWSKESMWGMGSTMTGPMMEGGDSMCRMGKYAGLNNFPGDESEYRAIILRAVDCDDYEPPQ